jgi:hypothetical protein
MVWWFLGNARRMAARTCGQVEERFARYLFFEQIATIEIRTLDAQLSLWTQSQLR